MSDEKELELELVEVAEAPKETLGKLGDIIARYRILDKQLDERLARIKERQAKR